MIIECAACGSANRVPAKRLAEHPRCGRCKTELSTERPLAVHSTAELDELVGAAPFPVLVDFWAPWCGPCRTVAPQLELLAKKKRGALVVAKVNTDEVPELGARFQVRSIPTMILFDGGRESRRVSGAMSADAIAQSVGI